jgi:hypothetical protein
MPEFVKIDGLLQRCGYSAATVKHMLCAPSHRYSGSSLVSLSEAIRRLESLANSKSGLLLVRRNAAILVEELRNRQLNQSNIMLLASTSSIGEGCGGENRHQQLYQASDDGDDRGRGLLLALSRLVEIDEKKDTIRTTPAGGLPVLVDLTAILSGRNTKRSNGCVRAIARKYFHRATGIANGDGLAKQLIKGERLSTQTPTYVPTTLRALLEFVLRIPEQLAGSPCLEAAPIIARYYGGDDGAALLDDILANLNSSVRVDRKVDAEEDAAVLPTKNYYSTCCEVGQEVAEVDVEEAAGMVTGHDEEAATLDNHDTKQSTEDDAFGVDESLDNEHSSAATTDAAVATNPRVRSIDRRPSHSRPPPPPPAPVFIYEYQGDTTTDCLYAMRIVPKVAEFGSVTLYKIGRSKDASVRRQEVSADFSETHWVSLCVVMVRAGDLELYFHRELSHYRVDDLTRRRNGRVLGASREVFDLLSSWSSSEDELLVKFKKLAETAIIHVQGGGGVGYNTTDRLRVLEKNNAESTSENSSESEPMMKRRRLVADELRLALEREKTLQVQAEAWRVDAEARKSEAESSARKAEAESSARKSEALVKKFEILSRLPEDVQRSLAASVNVWVNCC